MKPGYPSAPFCLLWSQAGYPAPFLVHEEAFAIRIGKVEPDWSKFQSFLNSEVRYTALKKSFPAEADELFATAEENAKWRYRSYQRMANMNWDVPVAE